MHDGNYKSNKIIVYGVGGYFRNIEKEILSLPNTCIIGIADSNLDNTGRVIAGFSVMAPSHIIDLSYDFIVITSIHAHEIKSRLIEGGVYSEKILNYIEYKGLVSKTRITHYQGGVGFKECTDSVLIITKHLDFSGSSIAAYYATLALKTNNIAVSIAASSFDKQFLDYLNDAGVDVWIVDNIEGGYSRNYDFLKKYNHVIINTYVMSSCINYFDSSVDVIMWLHEAKVVYNQMIRYWGAIPDRIRNVRVYGVSKKATNNFNQYYPEIATSILEYGIPDEFEVYPSDIISSDKIVMAVVGAIYETKGQKILLDAIDKMNNDIKGKCEFWLIGRVIAGEYSKEVVDRAKNMQNVKLYGEQSHHILMELYKKIDVIISSSIEDMLPIAVVEGMMLGKKCIIPRDIGLSEYVKDEQDVLKYETQNPADLCYKIERVVNNYNKMGKINKFARAAYQKTFSMDAFSERITHALKL